MRDLELMEVLLVVGGHFQEELNAALFTPANARHRSFLQCRYFMNSPIIGAVTVPAKIQSGK